MPGPEVSRGQAFMEGAGPDMSGPYRAAMMLRLRCHEGLRGVGDADSHRRGGFHIRPWEVRRRKLPGRMNPDLD